MTEQFTIACSKCSAKMRFEVADIPALERHITDERVAADSWARDETRDEVEAEFEGFVDGAELTKGSRPLQEMAVALRRGDIAEAERLLDYLADEIGDRAVEEVQQGRFSLRATPIYANAGA
jgi:hypothetical protein